MQIAIFKIPRNIKGAAVRPGYTPPELWPCRERAGLGVADSSLASCSMHHLKGLLTEFYTRLGFSFFCWLGYTMSALVVEFNFCRGTKVTYCAILHYTQSLCRGKIVYN
jgi:hypothetical protein